MVKRLLRKIRQKPKGVRDQIAMAVAIVFTGIIFVAWLINTPARFASTTSEGSTADAESGGFADIFDGFGEAVNRSTESTEGAGEAEADSEPSLAEMIQALEAERQESEGIGTSSTSTVQEVPAVEVWNSMPTTSRAETQREVMIMPVVTPAATSSVESSSE